MGLRKLVKNAGRLSCLALGPCADQRKLEEFAVEGAHRAKNHDEEIGNAITPLSVRKMCGLTNEVVCISELKMKLRRNANAPTMMDCQA